MSNLTLASDAPGKLAARAPRAPTVDLYGPVHKGLRRGLCQLLLRMGETSFADDAAARRVADEMEALFHLCALHLAIEEKFIHPAMGRGGVVARMDAQHVRHDQGLARLRAMMARVLDAPAGERAALARALYLDFSDFVAETLEHMTEEETTGQAVLGELNSAEELARIQERITASVERADAAANLRLMLPALTREERGRMLSGAKAKVPAEVFAGVMALAKEVLRPDDLADLEERVRA